MAKPLKPIRLADLSKAELIEVILRISGNISRENLKYTIKDVRTDTLSDQVDAMEVERKDIADKTDAYRQAMRHAVRALNLRPRDPVTLENFSAAVREEEQSHQAGNRIWRRMEALWREIDNVRDREVEL